MNIYLISFTFLLSGSLQVGFSDGSESSRPLCNFDDIHAELLKADEMLKRKAELQKLYSAEKQTLLVRQDDDDDSDLPYYVPAIAKVVGSVLARNVTSIIEESFGFIPPDINFDIRNVLGLIAGTITRLNPTTTPPPTEEPAAVEVAATNLTRNASTVDYEQLFAQALYQLHNQYQSNSSSPPSVIIISQDTPTAVPAVLPPNPASEFFQSTGQSNNPTFLQGPQDESPQPSEAKVSSTTFKYSAGQSITSSPDAPPPAADIDVPVYAPAFAPNYNVQTTTKIPIYAPSFDHNVYTTSPSPTKASAASSAAPLSNSSKTEAPSTSATSTTEEEEDYDAIFSSTDSGTASAASTTTVDPDEDGDEY